MIIKKPIKHTMMISFSSGIEENNPDVVGVTDIAGVDST